MIHIQIPATSANMGPGFDSIGVAVQLYNHIWVEEQTDGLTIEVRRKQELEVPTDETNLIYQTMKFFYEKKGLPMPGIHLIQEDYIPMVRGLGSSAACIVGGLLAANELAGRPCTRDELAQMAAMLEGHPDNSNPALFGGMVVGAQNEKEMKYVRLELPEDLVFAIMVPDFPVSTAASRGVLPDSYTRKDVVFNASRAALLVASVMTGNYENFDMAMQDKVHQPYRAQLIDGMEEIFRHAKDFGAVASYLSGAGSTLMAMVTKEKAEKFEREMSAYLGTLPHNWKLQLLQADRVGARVERVIPPRKVGQEYRRKKTMLIVQKYGGSSVANAERVFNVAKRIMRTRMEGNDVVVVLSAQGKTTDGLIAKAKEINAKPSRREMDMLLSTGEQQSVALMAMAISAIGGRAVSLNAAQVGIETTNTYSNARIRHINTERIENELDEGSIVLVTGFQGVNAIGDTTTLGRGGSDTSAVALAAALNADMCEIYTDVEGVYTADPRVVPDAVKLDEISYDEMLELASLGAKVLHSRSVEVAKKYNVKLVVRSSMSEAEGTEVKEDVKMERMLVSGVAADKKVSRISIMGINDEPGKAFEVFSLMAKEKVSVDIILQSTGADGKQNISFTIGEDDLDIALKALEKNKERLTAREIVHDENTAKLSIVGAGMATNPGVAAMFFEAMYDAGVNIQMISTSEIKITVLIAKDDVDAAMVAVHDKFKMASVNMRKAADTEE